MARPTDYTPEILEQSRQYLHQCKFGTEDDPRPKLPTIEGLALFLDISRDTVYAWEKEKEPFSYIVEEVRAQQAETLVQNGLTGQFNPTITKLMLSKHGYVERQDVTSGDKPVAPLLVRFLGDDKSDTGDTEGV